jgi:hypothetical protein
VATTKQRGYWLMTGVILLMESQDDDEGRKLVKSQPVSRLVKYPEAFELEEG